MSGAQEPAKAARTVLAKGASGEQVMVLQRLLNAAGYQVSLDGQFGPITSRAVKAFQRRRSLLPDSVVGPTTWRALVGDTEAGEA